MAVPMRRCRGNCRIMKIVSTAQMRELDRRTIEEFEVPGEMLMDRAGFGVALAVEHLFELYGFENRAVHLVAGRGNNGGDAFVAARYLKDHNYEVAVWVAGSMAEIRGDARTHLSKLSECKVPIEELPTKEDWDALATDTFGRGFYDVPVIIDGILGTGLQGPARGPAAGAINYVNRIARHALIVAIDVPSGLNSDTGGVDGDAVHADLTVTMGLPKRGLIEPEAADYVGRLEVVDIGIPWALVEKIESEIEVIAPSEVGALFPRRTRHAHKGVFGHVLIVGGAAGYAGAVMLAARAALRSGVGLVTVVVPRCIASIVAVGVPEAMVHAVPETESGSLSAGFWPQWRERVAGRVGYPREFGAVLAGPGMTPHAETAILVEQLLKDSTVPLVLDADALNVFVGRMEDLSRRVCPLVITPHPGELARLMGGTALDIQADRFKAARDAAQRSRTVTVLKGAGTLVAQAGEPLQINVTGNPGMATGGTGDALAGLLAGILAQGVNPLDAARAAVFVHGRAGDIGAAEKTEICLTAGDLINYLPFAFQDILPR